MATRALNVTISGDERKLNGAFQSGAKHAEEFGKKSAEASDRAAEGFKKVHEAGKLLAEIGGLTALTFGLKDVTEEAVSAEAEQKKLANTVKDAGLSWRAHSEEVEKWLDKTSRASGFLKSDLEGALGNFIRTTGSVTKAQALESEAMDVARSKGVGLANAQSILARVYNGSYTGLKRLGIAIKPVTTAQDELKTSTGKITDEQKAHAKALDDAATRTEALGIIQDKFGGQSKAFASSTAGSFERARASLNLFEENVGKVVLPIMAKAADAIARIGDSAERNWPKVQATAQAAFKAIQPYLITFEGALTKVEATIDSFAARNQIDLSSVSTAWSTSTAKIRAFLDAHKKDIDSIRQAVENVSTAVQAVINSVLIPAFKIILPEIRKQVAGIIQVLQGLIELVSGLLTGNWSRAWQGLKDIAVGQFKAIVAFVTGEGKLLLAAGKAAGKAIGDGLSAGFKAAVGGLKSLVVSLLNDVIGLMNNAIGAINKATPGAIKVPGLGTIVPAIPDIPSIPSISGGGSSSGSSGAGSGSSKGSPSEGGPHAARASAASVGSKTTSHTLSRPVARVASVSSAKVGSPGVQTSGGRASKSQLMSAWVGAGGPQDWADTMASVALAESGGYLGAHNTNGEDSRGPWQINVGPGANTDLAGMALFTLAGNARAAVIVFTRAGANAWTMYRNGTWKRYAGSGGSSITSTTGASSGSGASKTPTHGSDSSGPVPQGTPPAYTTGGYDADNGLPPGVVVKNGKIGYTWPTTGNTVHPIPFAQELARRGVPSKGLSIDDTASLQSARDSAPGAPTAEDWINAEIAQASLTSSTADDITGAQHLYDLRGSQYDSALGTNDPRQIAAAAQALASARDALLALKGSIDQSNELQQQQVTLMQQQLDQTRTALNVSQSQYNMLTQWIAGVANRGIGNSLGLSLSGLRSPAGSVSRT